MAKKNNIIKRVEDIDEKELIEFMAGTGSKIQDVHPELKTEPKQAGQQKREPEPEPEFEDEIIDEPVSSKETFTSKKSSDYKSLFLSPRVLKVRQCVYISQEIHEKICKIVNEIADKELTVGTYVDTVLRQHLKKNRNEINALYKRERGDLV